MKNQNNYFFEIIILPIFIIIFLVISITTYNIQITKEQLNKQIANKKVEYLENEKRVIYNKVQFLNTSIKIENSKIESKLREKLKERIETAIKISNDVYKENKKLSKKITTQVLARRLSFLKYNDNRGYYFILDKNNRFLEHPMKDFIGKNMKNFVDVKGNNIVNNIKNSVKNEKIGFTNYYFFKPKNNKNQFLKLVAVTYYKPLNLYIGIGEYIDVVRNELKNDFINKLSQNNDLNNYVFVLDLLNINGGERYAKTLVNNNNKESVGKYLSDNVSDLKGNFYRKEYLKVLRENGDGFVSYWYKKPGLELSKEKLTYFYFNKEWNWIIASGFYLEDLDSYIEKLKKESDTYLNNLISNSIFWGLIFSFVTILISSMIFYRIQKRINNDKEKLLYNEENLKKAQKISKIGSWDYNLKTEEINWSDEIFEILELSKDFDKVSYKSFISFVCKDDRTKVNLIFSDSTKNKSSHQFIHRLYINKKIKWVENQSNIYFDKEKDSYIMIGTLQDITEKYEKDKKIEEQSQLLFNQSKMAAMGEMIENIAHQWRQPLSAISTSASGVKVELEYGILNNDKLEHSLDDILSNTTYLSNTIDDFRKYFVQDKIKTVSNIKDVYKKSMKLLKSKFNDLDIEIIESCEDIECEILENELIQCFMNILNNAYDVMMKNSVENKVVFVDIFKEYENVVINIKDNGGGIENHIVNKVFEPYFTTKHKSQGTGIGLYMTQEIITKHLNGYIKVKNEEFRYKEKKYKGASFKISIPLSDLSKDLL